MYIILLGVDRQDALRLGGDLLLTDDVANPIAEAEAWVVVHTLDFVFIEFVGLMQVVESSLDGDFDFLLFHEVFFSHGSEVCNVVVAELGFGLLVWLEMVDVALSDTCELDVELIHV